jgi:hypothetical protein
MDELLFGCFVGALDGQVRLDGEEVGEGRALFVGELTADTVGVDHGLALGWRGIAKFAEGACDEATAVDGKSTELLHGAANLLALGYGEVLHGLGALEEALALSIGHAIELGEAVEHALLGLGWQLAESGLVLEGSLLLCEGEVPMTVHPLREMFLILTRAGRSGCDQARARGMRTAGKRLGGEQAGGPSEADNGQDGAKTAPDWRGERHWGRMY